MLRVRLRLPKREDVSYRFLDLIHDALINAWIEADASPEQVIGPLAAPWTFAALGHHQQRENRLHTLVVSTADPHLAGCLQQLDTDKVLKIRPSTGESVDLSKADKIIEPDPILPQQGRLPALLLSPLAIRERHGKGWRKEMGAADIGDAINARLSRLAGRQVRLTITPDSLYLRANPHHSVLVPTKGFANGKISFVIGLSAPLTLSGSDDDLRFAWYAGIGEKNRNGFGCLGILEEGVGR